MVTLVVALAACGGTGSSSGAVANEHRTSTTVSDATTTTTTTTTERAAAITGATEPAFLATVAGIEGDVRRALVGHSWRPGCPVPLDQLRYVTLSYWGFDGGQHMGELVVNADAVDAIREAFRRLFAARFPIRSMRLVDDFGADDFASIEADNTSAFNCRERSTGGGVWSQHVYGRAIDVDPIENPYVDDGTTTHPASRTYLDRSQRRPGMAYDGGALRHVRGRWMGLGRTLAHADRLSALLERRPVRHSPRCAASDRDLRAISDGAPLFAGSVVLERACPVDVPRSGRSACPAEVLPSSQSSHHPGRQPAEECQGVGRGFDRRVGARRCRVRQDRPRDDRRLVTRRRCPGPGFGGRGSGCGSSPGCPP